MNKNDLIRKGLVLGIIVLFVGAGIVPSIGGNIGKISSIYDSHVRENRNHIQSRNNGERATFLDDPPEEEWNQTFGGSRWT